MKIVALFSAKGGVGKSTLSASLAHVAATQSGRRTLLWDLDPQGASGFLLGVEPKSGAKARKGLVSASLAELIQPSAWPNLDVLAADRSLRRLEADLAGEDSEKRLKRALKPLEDHYDRVILDCPPGLTELADQMFRAVDLIVVPAVPSPLSGRAVAQLRAHLEEEMKSPPPLLPVFSMADRRKSLHKAAMESNPDWPVIPYASTVEAMAASRQPVASGPAARAINALWATVERRLLA